VPPPTILSLSSPSGPAQLLQQQQSELQHPQPQLTPMQQFSASFLPSFNVQEPRWAQLSFALPDGQPTTDMLFARHDTMTDWL
jgi:hypothetical protein